MLNDFNRWLQDSVFKPLEDKKMPVMEHLVELQVRLTRAVIVTAIVFVATFFYADTLVKWLRIPLQNMFVPSALSWEPTDLPSVPFVFLAPAEALWQNVKVAGLFAVVLATPYILMEFWQFVVPGLHVQERRFVGPFVFLSTLAFYVGVTFSFFFVLPFALNFLISYGVSAGFIPQLSIAQYVGMAGAIVCAQPGIVSAGTQAPPSRARAIPPTLPTALSWFRTRRAACPSVQNSVWRASVASMRWPTA